MALNKRLIAYELNLKNFRAFRDVSIPLGHKLTVISGVNGVGKSNIISLIASGSGLNKRSSLGSNFQPEFSDFFNIEPDEPYTDYKLYLKYAEENGEHALVKRLSFKDDTSTNRGIRIIPRTVGNDDTPGIKEAEKVAKEKYEVGGAARVPIPTIYLSLSRLYPLGERRSSVTVNKMKKSSPYAQNDIMDKYREWYNHVIPGAIRNDAEYSVIEKQACSRASLHMDIENTPTLSQSIGQDNIGNIISALVDIYRLSLDEGYNGAILCIDEIEVSLHPDTQVKLLELLDTLAESLKIQIILSTHSLTVLKEYLKKEQKDNKNYQVVYLKNPTAPYITEKKSYELLKADMFGSLQYNKIKVRMYFEDEVGQQLFESLLLAYKDILQKVKVGKEKADEKVLRNADAIQNCSSINNKIIGLERILQYKDNLNQIVTHIGCDSLLDISKADKYFDRVIIMLDGDARIKDSKAKPMVKDYLDKPYKPSDHHQSERSHKKNIIFAPGYFAPESYLYKIIKGLYFDAIASLSFWRSMDASEDTALYTSDKIKALFSNLQENFNNDDLKKIFGEKIEGEVWDFINKSELLSYYYADYKNVKYLLEFLDKFAEAYEMTYPLTISNRYS